MTSAPIINTVFVQYDDSDRPKKYTKSPRAKYTVKAEI